MATAPFMQLYVADYLGDTQHLSCEQHGAYILLLMTMWRAGGSLPDDDVKLARIVRLSPAKWARISDDIKAFFDVSDGLLTQGRLAVELEKALQKSSKRSEAGAKGGHAKSLKTNNPDVAIATAEPKHSSDIRYHKEEKGPSNDGCTKPAKGRRSYPADFSEFWFEYPTDSLMSKTEAAKAFSRLTDDDKRAVIQPSRPTAQGRLPTGRFTLAATSRSAGSRAFWRRQSLRLRPRSSSPTRRNGPLGALSR
jgi:uncharacterized protein YdaU (DUF1376 family)